MCKRCNKPCACAPTVGPVEAARNARGVDNAARVSYGSTTLFPAVMAQNPLTNQSEFGAPHSSAQGRALHSHAAQLSHQPPPIPYYHRFGGDIGLMLVRNMRGTTIPYDAGYEGVLPMIAQPKLVKPLPYAR